MSIRVAIVCKTLGVAEVARRIIALATSNATLTFALRMDVFQITAEVMPAVQTSAAAMYAEPTILDAEPTIKESELCIAGKN